MHVRPLVCRFTAVAMAVAIAAAPSASAADSERDLGERFAFAAAARLPLVQDPDVTAYVDGIGQRVVAALGTQPYTYHFAVIRDGGVNAFAVPGGFIYVHTGLLARLGNDDELASVLGHEVAHVNAHHLVRQQEKSQLLNYATLLGLVASVLQPAIGAAALGASAAASLQYRREFEQEADYLGAGYMRQAGFEPRAMLDFFQKMSELQRSGPAVPPYLLSHPMTDERLNNLEAVLRKKQWERAPRPQPSDALSRAQAVARMRTEPGPRVLEDYQKAAAAAPDDGRSQALLGLVLLESGNYDAARASLERAQALGYAVDRDLGRVMLLQRQPEAARPFLARAAEANPNDVLAQIELGRVLELLGETAGARRAYERAVQIDPSQSDAHYQLGMLTGRSGDDGIGLYHLALAHQARGEYVQAASFFQRALPLLQPGETREQAKRDADRLRALMDQG